MMSARQLAKAVLFHARAAHIRALAAPRRVAWVRRRLHLPSNETFDPLHDDAPNGVKVTRLDPASTFRRPLPHLPDGNADAHAFFAARTVESLRPTCVAEFEGGIAWGHPTGGVFTNQGRFVPGFTHDPCGEAHHAVWTRLRLPKPKPLAGRVLYLVTPEATDNFHHWLIDLLPRLGLVQRACYRLADFDRVIVNHASRRYQFSTLERLGIPREKLIAADTSLFVRAEQLVVPSLKASNQTLPLEDIAFLRRSFLADAQPARPSRRIFLSRADAAFRRLSNEAELHPLLRAHDFEIITPGGLDLSAQARLFADAEIIAGPAGAGFANLVFATAPARVIEIAQPGWLAAFHWMISARVGLPHTVVLGEGAVMRGVPDSSARERDIVVQPEKLERLLVPTATAV
ncbi:MAG TPA: glycosyltransferase family 61 protein [Opitutus sp.]|nr:glycosyltransferase family 61 protein [Opitutus sp.]